MYFTHKFTDTDTRRDVVKHNTKEMVFSYFWSQMQVTFPGFTGMTLAEMSDTKEIISQWVNDNIASANLWSLADFASRLVDDYIENNTDREADHDN